MPPRGRSAPASELAARGETARKRNPELARRARPRELEIAAGCRRGHEQREVAARLFLSPKTVELHLRRVYRKLGIGSRAELAEAFARTDRGSDG